MVQFFVRVFVAFLLSTVVLGGVGSGVAQAQTDPCAASNFVDADKNFDLAGYLACVASAASGSSSGSTLPQTGSEVGPIVGLSSAFVILGGAVVYGSRSRRRSVAV